MYLVHDLGHTSDQIPDGTPIEYIRYIQCTEMYHCLPSQLADEDEMEIDKHWIIRNKVAAINESKNSKKGTTTINANANSFEGADTDKF